MSIKSFIEKLLSKNKNYKRKKNIQEGMKDLPLGIQDFKKIREKNYLYIDKTEHLYNLIDRGEVYFLSRPRRFGKSLTVSTLEYLFKGEKELFKGTYIYDKHDFEERPVIKLSMTSIDTSSVKSLKETLIETLQDICEDYNIDIHSKYPKTVLKKMVKKLAKRDNKVVILIDEYDKPILNHIENKEKADKIRKELRNFYSILKDLGSHLKYIFITGITKASKVSIFSDLNQLTDLTLNSEMSDMLGYTKEDIAEFFPERIEKVREELELTEEEFWSKLQEWYNGYSWNGQDFVYNPYSILNFFFNNEFDNYWFESGSPSFLIKYMKENNLKESKFNKVRVGKNFHSKYDIEESPPYSFLWQAGYLTIKEKVENTYLLEYPNKEVQDSMNDILLTTYYNLEEEVKGEITLNLRRAIKRNDIDTIIQEFKRTLSSITFHQHIKKESYYNTAIYTLLRGTGINAKIEEATSKGRSDLVIEEKEKVFVFEFKNDKPEVGIEQIKEKGYAEKYDKKKFFVGIELDFDKRNIVDYKVEEQV